ncbi:MAG: DUF3050 domain-containing protein [Nitrospinae bacterium]|nr:DUF3050 domain-containing protein [Nitrospinota bacterium]
MKEDPIVKPLLQNRHLKRLKETVKPLRDGITNHPVYSAVKTIEDLKTFMACHVFAVYDFMCLLKALQSSLTCVSVPWVPKSEKLIRRFINHMVLEEETDEDARGGYASHLELYISAMEQCGADTDPINSFLDMVGRGVPLMDALDKCGAPEPSRQFVSTTWKIIETGETHRIAAAFTFGREDPIPDMFRSLIKELRAKFPGRLDIFEFYLERHIHLDEDFHNPMASLLVTRLCIEDPVKWNEAAQTAETAIMARKALWDGARGLIEENAAATAGK